MELHERNKWITVSGDDEKEATIDWENVIWLPQCILGSIRIDPELYPRYYEMEH